MNAANISIGIVAGLGLELVYHVLRSFVVGARESFTLYRELGRYPTNQEMRDRIARLMQEGRL
jgi:hypothetical protein